MTENVMGHLQELQPASSKRLSNSLVTAIKMFLQYNKTKPVLLVDPVQIANTNWTKKPKKGVDSLAQAANRHAARKIMKLDAGLEHSFTYSLNTALLGGGSYPVLTAILGTAAGIASFGGGLLFAATTTAIIDVAKPSQRILARRGDEIWQVEEIGKVKHGSGYKVIHVNSYWLVDPFRRQSTYSKGWLIHEERGEVTVN